MSSIRDQVHARIITTMEEAVAAGLNAMTEAGKVYPDVPLEVIVECWAKLDVNEAEHWWRSMEKTIDGEVLHRAAGQISHELGTTAESTAAPGFTEEPGLDFDPFVAPHEDDPAGGWDPPNGLTLRDRFAMAALPAIQNRIYGLNDGEGSPIPLGDGIAETAYDLADAMLAVRGRQ